MIKRMFALSLVFIMLMVSVHVFADPGDDATNTSIQLDKSTKYIVFPVTSTAATGWADLKWRTIGFEVTLWDMQGNIITGKSGQQHPLLSYTSAHTGNAYFAIAIYQADAGKVTEVAGATGDITASVEELYDGFTEKIKKEGGKIHLEPIFTVLMGDSKTAITYQNGDCFYNHYIDYYLDLPEKYKYTLAEMDANEWENVSFPDSAIEDMATRKGDVTFQAQALPDFKTRILRTGTEDFSGKAEAGKEYEILVECSVTKDEADNIAMIPTASFETQDGLRDSGGVTLTESKLVEWRDTKTSDKTMNNYQDKVQEIEWAKNIPDASNRLYPYVYWTTPYDATKDIYSKISDDKKIGKRYLVYKWKPMYGGTVKIKSKINLNSSNNPILPESDSTNNTDEITISVAGPTPPPKAPEPVPTTGNFLLNYDELAKNFQYKLNNGAALTATVSKPPDGNNWRYTWAGDTTGQLVVNVDNSSGVLKNLNIDGDGPLTGAELSATTVTRYPEITWTTTRDTFNDKPGSKVYLGNLSNPSLTFRLQTDTNISKISKSYESEHYEIVHSCSQGSSSCGYYTETDPVPPATTGTQVWHWNSGHSSGHVNYAWVYKGTNTATAPFGPVIDHTLSVQNLVYNGIGLPTKEFTNISTAAGLTRRVEWASDPIKVPVTRWMSDGGNLTEVPGQYDRSFRQLNTADITFSKVQTMQNWFSTDINNALSSRKGAEYYPHAPFATERALLSRYDYPLKSGYYCNPGGYYKVTLKTVIYKEGSGNSTQHANLVNKIKAAFRYKSNIQYTTDGKNVYSLDFPKNNNANVHIWSDPIEKDPPPRELKHKTDGGTADTDVYLRQILEGWEDSGTADSYDNYKYREYVKSANIYEVTEKTTIYIRVNDLGSLNQKKYTHTKMPNGDYWMNSWFEDFDFEGGDVSGVDLLDGIGIRIQGSMYDDLYSNEND